MSVNSILTKDYKRNDILAVTENKPKTNPISLTPKGVKQKSDAGPQRSDICLLPSVFCLLSMAMSEKSIFAIIIGLLFHIRPLRTSTSISEITRSLSVRTFPSKNKLHRLKLGAKKILQYLRNLIYIIRNSGARSSAVRAVDS